MAKTTVRGTQITDGTVDLTVDVTGTLPVANGGTSKASITANSLLVGNGAGVPTELAPGSAGNVPRSNGTAFVSAPLPVRSFPLNSKTVAIGDSIVAGNGIYTVQQRIPESWFGHLCVESEQRIQWYGWWGTGGYTLSDILATHIPNVLSMSPAPGACIIMGGTNDIINGVAFATSKTNLISIITSLLQNNITPILTTLPPIQNSQAINQSLTTFNEWIVRYSAANGYSLLDFYSALVDVNSFFTSGYTADGVHPLGVANHAMSLRAINEGVPRIYAVSGVPTSQHYYDANGNMLNDGGAPGSAVTFGTFMINGSGVGQGWTSATTGTAGVPSIVTPLVTDEVNGLWQQLSRTVGDTGVATITSNSVTTGFTAATDVVAFAARVQTEDIELVTLDATDGWGLYVLCNGATNTNLNKAGIVAWQSDTDGLVYVEFTVPAGTTSMQVQLAMTAVSAGTGSPKIRMGEVTLRNLTTRALLT